MSDDNPIKYKVATESMILDGRPHAGSPQDPSGSRGDPACGLPSNIIFVFGLMFMPWYRIY